MIDYRAQLAALPKRPGAHPQNAPLVPASQTLHYSGVAYQDRRTPAEHARIFAEARHHLAKDWDPDESDVVYLSRLQYHQVVLSDGDVVLCNDLVQLAHAGNRTANRTSIAVHVMLGGNQDLTTPQRASLFALFDQNCRTYNLPRAAVYGHNEWPRGDGAAQPSAVYRVMPPQSACPGRVLHAHLVAWRGGLTTSRTYQAKALCDIRPEANDDKPRRGRLTAGGLVNGVVVEGERITRAGYGTSALWLRLDAAAGYIWLPQLEAL